jgi:hypothetical protein
MPYNHIITLIKMNQGLILMEKKVNNTLNKNSKIITPNQLLIQAPMALIGN